MPETQNGGRILLAMVWPSLVLLVVVMLGSVGLVVGVAFIMGASAGDIGRLIGESHAISRLVALVIIVPAIVTLALLDKISGSATIAALSAIAGYVLGGTTGSP
jgi:hypothetical protein